jgi:hypothetical protein
MPPAAGEFATGNENPCPQHCRGDSGAALLQSPARSRTAAISGLFPAAF